MSQEQMTSPSLATILEAVRQGEGIVDSLPEIRVRVLRNYTIEAMLPLFKFHFMRHGLHPNITVGDYDGVRQEILDAESPLYREKPDLVVLSLILEHLDPNSAAASWNRAQAEEETLSMLRDLVARTATPVLVNTFMPPLRAENMLDAARHADHRVSSVNELNAALRAFARSHPGQVFIVDWENILKRLGEERVFDHRFYYLYRAPFRKEFADEYGAQIAKVGRLLKGKIKKCLVLDCDNTLWGGVVGEDGVEGIRLDPHEFPGRCYYDFQRSILNLMDQGVVVALCSKNNERDVLDVLEGHPHSLLKPQHLAAWRINWSNKAENVAALARELNLGLDSFVFVDDSSMECDLVKTALPEVTVLQVPEQIYHLPALLYRDGWFDTLSRSAEDASRTAMYVAERERSALRNTSATLDEYLASLKLLANIYRAKEEDLGRVAQLIGKTNQFNLTTRRHSEAAVRNYAKDARWAIYVMRAKDRFSDLGAVAVLITERTGTVGRIDSLLMSCRALGRKLEDVFVDECLSRLEAEWGIERWQAEYIPTKKNGQVRDFWPKMGFVAVKEEDGSTLYEATPAVRKRPGIDFISLEGD